MLRCIVSRAHSHLRTSVHCALCCAVSHIAANEWLYPLKITHVPRIRSTNYGIFILHGSQIFINTRIKYLINFHNPMHYYFVIFFFSSNSFTTLMDVSNVNHIYSTELMCNSYSCDCVCNVHYICVKYEPYSTFNSKREREKEELNRFQFWLISPKLVDTNGWKCYFRFIFGRE